jgi:hypothetical protein
MFAGNDLMKEIDAAGQKIREEDRQRVRRRGNGRRRKGKRVQDRGHITSSTVGTIHRRGNRSVALVQGTDPEAVLLLEAVHRDGSPRWQYAFAPATSGGLEVRLDKRVVRAVDLLAGTTIPRDPQMWLSRPRSTTASGG